MKLLIATALLLFTSLLHAQSVYKWVDNNGNVQYSQTPPAGHKAQKSELPKETGQRADLGRYCEAVRQFAEDLALRIQRGMSSMQAIQRAREAETELIELGAKRVGLKEVGFYVATRTGQLKSRRESPFDVARLAHTACMTGRFAVIETDLTKPPPSRETRTSSGTGWFVASGVVVTSLHVVKGATDIRIFLDDGTDSSARIGHVDQEHDLAVLNTVATSPAALPIRDTPIGIGAAVFTIGFPHPGIMGKKPKLADGVISSLSGALDDVGSYQISVPVQAGNSGGPLLDMHGAVVGVISSKLRADVMQHETGDMTENVNYAVKSSYIGHLLMEEPTTTDLPDEPLEVVAQRVKPSVVRVVAVTEPDIR